MPAVAIHAGVVGDDADPPARERFELLLFKDIEPGQSLRRRRGREGLEEQRGREEELLSHRGNATLVDASAQHRDRLPRQRDAVAAHLDAHHAAAA
jgi:hypothetical protein